MVQQAQLGAWSPYPSGTGVVGDLRVVRDVEVPRLGRVTDLYAWLPPGHDESSATYPVVYLHDGGNLFDPAVAHSGVTWQVDRAMAALAAQGMPAIAVGVPCSPTARGEEYTPRPHPDKGGGRADDYVAFLADELKPAVDATFRTAPGPESTVVAGSSLGGVVSAHAWATRPEVFGGAGVFSPAFWWPGEEMIEDLHRRLAHRPVEDHQRVYLDVGGREQPDDPAIEAAYVRDAETLLGMLRTARVPVRYVYDSQAWHFESAWAERFPAAVRWLLSGYAVGAPPPAPLT